MTEPVSGSVLDIGSADGFFTKAIYDAAKPKQIIGIDVLKSSVAYAARRYRQIKAMTFRLGDAEKLKFPTRKFSAVFILEALEHVHNAPLVMREIYRVLKPGGYMVILVPSENWLFKLGWPIWTHTRGRVWHETHLNFFNGSQLPQLVKVCGFKDIETHAFILGMLLLVKARKSI